MAHGAELTLAIDLMAFGATPLLQDFHLQVASGQTLALIGPSGVGKTTILRILAGIETGFDGVATVDGRTASAAPVPGLVFQDARLLPWLSCAANLRAVRPGLTEAEAAHALVSVGLAGLGPAWPRALSGGMQRRLGLARALLVNPRLLLLDEPFVSLDKAVIRDLHALVAERIADNVATAVLVSHDPSDAARLAHRVVLIAGSPVRIVADLMLNGDPASRSKAEVAICVEWIETTMAAVASNAPRSFASAPAAV